MPTNQVFSHVNSNKYYPAVLSKTKSNGWMIVYYSMHPQTNEMERFRVKINKIVGRYRTEKERKYHALELLQAVNNKLAGGWSPFYENEDARLYVKLTEVCRLFIEERKRELRENTMRSYISFCKMLTEWANKNAKDIYFSIFNHNYAIRYMDYIYNDRKVSSITYNNSRKMAIAFWNWAIEKCYTKQNAFVAIKNKRKEDKKRIIIPAETREKIKNYLIERENYPFLLVCNLVYSSLLRPNEIRQIKIEYIHLKEKYILVPSNVSKNHKERYAALSDESISILEKMNISKYPRNWYLVGGLLNQLKPSKEMAYMRLFGKEWADLRKKLKLTDNMQLYSFRDTGIFDMLKSGIDDLSVMQHADHSSLDITTRYAKHRDSGLIEKINKNVPKF